MWLGPLIVDIIFLFMILKLSGDLKEAENKIKKLEEQS